MVLPFFDELVQARTCVPICAWPYVQKKGIGALFQLYRTNRIINGHNLGNTWEAAQTDEEEQYQTLKRHILRFQRQL